MSRVLSPVLLFVLLGASCPDPATRPAPSSSEQPDRGHLERVDGLDIWVDMTPSRPVDTVETGTPLCNTQQGCSSDEVVRTAAERARSLSADGAIISTESTPLQPQVAIQGGGGYRIRYTAVIIRYRRDGQTTVPGTAASPPAGLVYLPAGSIVDKDSIAPPAGSRQPLTDAETVALRQAVAALPTFPRYLFSGCHDRAHAAYLLLPAALRAKADKVWLFSPSRYTSAVQGTLRLAVNEPYADQVSWGYHVALLFKTPGGDLVLDPALAPGALIEPAQWFALMTIPPPSFWTVLAGHLYLFNDSGKPNFGTPPFPHRNTKLINGFFYGYVGEALQENRIVINLARDAAGVELMAGTQCGSLQALISQPDSLLTMLKRPDQPAECASVKRTFDSERDVWSQRLARIE